MKTLGYYNGACAELDQMRVPMLDRACYFGDAVYDATYSVNYRIFALEEHIERFSQSAEAVGMALPMSAEDLAALLRNLNRRLENGNQFVYFQLSRGTALREHSLDNLRPNLWIMLKPQELKDLSKPYRLVTERDGRYDFCNIKTINLLPNVLAAYRAQASGADECVFIRNGFVTECAHSNICLISAGKLVFPRADSRILNGIARRHLRLAAIRCGIPAVEREIFASELFGAEEVLVTSSGALCMRVAQIDGIDVGGKDDLRYAALRDAVVSEFRTATL